MLFNGSCRSVEGRYNMNGKQRKPGAQLLMGVGGLLGLVALALLLIVALAAVPAVLLKLDAEQYRSGASKPDQLIFQNESQIPVGQVILSTDCLTHSLHNGNWSALEAGEQWSEDWDNWPCTVTALCSDGGTIATLTVEEEPEIWKNYRSRWYVTLRDGPSGPMLALTPVPADDYGDRVDRMSDLLGVDLSGGTVLLHRGMPRGWQGDGEDFILMVFSEADGAALEEALADGEGWRPAEGRNADLLIFDGSAPECGQAVTPAEGSRYFFLNHNGEGDSIWSDSGADRIDLIWNCTAAIYDPAARTLYYFDHDM